MGVVQKCLNLLRLQQRFGPNLEFGKPVVTDWGYPEQEVISYLKSWNPKLKQDAYGNLYLINPGTPLLSAHMDTVQCKDDVVGMPKIKINKKKGTISYNNSIIGGDDKCGIAMAMQLYEKYGDKVSLIFSRQEETGHKGASAFCQNHFDLLKQCKYCLVLDRRNAGDIIGYENGYCSEEFQAEIHRCTKDFGYKPEVGLLSDADAFSKYINCVNLSVGYYDAHRKTEYIVVEELKNAVKAVENIIENFQGEYEIYKEPEKSSYYGGSYGKGSLYGYSYWGGRYGREDRDNLDDDYGYGYSYQQSQKKNKSNSWNTYQKKEEKKADDGFSERQKIVRGYFKLNHDGDVEIKEDLVFVNVDNPDEAYDLPSGTYQVLTWDEYDEVTYSLPEEEETNVVEER